MIGEKNIQLNIAFKIPESIAKAAVDLSSEIAQKEDVYFVLNNVDYFPHITNYSVEFPEVNLEKIIEALEKIAVNFSSVEFVFKYNKAKLGWVCVFFNYSQEIRNLHKTIVETVTPLKANLIGEFSENSADLTVEQFENIKKYNKPNILNLYEPHLTITRLKDMQVAENVAEKMEWKIEKFKSDTIGIFISGEHGTCIKLIKEFKLK